VTYTRAALHDVMSGSRRIGYIFQSSRGFTAFDAKDVPVGNFSSAEAAIAAVAAGQAGGDPGPKLGPKLASTADNGRLSDRR
jgi:hypothetical protein